MTRHFDEAMPLAELSSHMRFASLKLNPRKLGRWISVGISGVHLKSFAVGRVKYVSPDSLISFFNAVAEARIKNPPSESSVRKPDSEKLRAALREGGLI